MKIKPMLISRSAIAFSGTVEERPFMAASRGDKENGL
jgi:hypothetical protein